MRNFESLILNVLGNQQYIIPLSAVIACVVSIDSRLLTQFTSLSSP